LLALFFMALFAASTAAYMYAFSLLVGAADNLGGGDAIEKTRRYAYTILPVLLGVAFLSGFADFFQRILSNALALNSVAKMQKQMLRAAHRADLALFARESSGNLMSKFTFDVKVVSDALIRVLSNLIKDVLTVIFTVGYMLYVNWQLTLVLLIFILALWPIIELSKKLRGSAAEVQAHTGKLTSDLKESFSGARMIKAYGLESYEDKRLGTEFDTRIRLFLRLVTQQAWVEPILTVLGGLVIAGVITFGVWQVVDERTQPETIVAILTGVMILAPRLRALGTLNNVIQEGLAALTRIFGVIDEAPAIRDADNAATLTNPKGHVKLDQACFSYGDGTEALRGVSLEAKPGQTIALVGASGGGKSTIINLIPRLYDVTGGQVCIDGTDIRHLALASLRGAMALVSQDVTLFDDTVAANIGFGDQSAGRDDIINAAQAADAHDFIIGLPHGYDTVLGEDGDTLSGGQKQRLAIARAILRDAPILLLDEATSALDAESESKVQAALERLSNGRTTIVIAHRLSTVQKADKIYVLENGQVVESGTHKVLSKKKGGVYAKLRDLQLH
jgi:subfamily B ATP-binding cassette protein MsbA